MTGEASDKSARERQLQEVLVAYLEAVETGKKPDPQEFLGQYPEFAAELAEFFANRAQLDRLAVPLRRLAEAAQAEAAARRTMGPEGGASNGASPGDKVRYFGDYELLEEIARGGMGVVFKARQVSLNRVVALKMILSGELASPADVQRFHAEAEAAANLDHPNIVPIYEVGDHNGQHYFSMKLIEGGSLAKRMPDLVSDPKAAMKLLAVVARAVHHAHQRGILHRDLKPGNILMDAQGRPHVTDFGLAKRVESDKGLTQSGAIVGTPNYMPPEQAAGHKDISTAADVYSLGAVLYELLTGRPPFRGESTLETLMQVMEREPERPRVLNSLIDRDLDTICLRCLEKEPTRRYGSAEALAEDGERWLEGLPIRARPASRWERAVKWAKRRPAVAALVGILQLVILLSIVAGGWMWARTTQALHDAQWQLYVTSVTLARRELDDRNFEQADARLNACPSHLRHWEWHYLDRECHPEQRSVNPQMGSLFGVAWSRDGRTIAVAGSAFRIELIDAQTGRRLRSLEGPQGSGLPKTALAFDAAGRSVAAALNQEVLVWDVASGALTHTLKGHTAAVKGVAFSPDGRLLASGGSDHAVRLWDMASGGVLHNFLGHEGAVNGVAFRPDGRHLASAGDDGVKIWDVPGRKLVSSHDERVPWSDQKLPRRALAYSPNGRTLAVGMFQGILLYDTETGAPVPMPVGQVEGLLSHVAGDLVFSADGAWLVSAGGDWDKAAIVWDMAARQRAGVLRGHAGPVPSVAFDPNGGRVVTSSWDKTLRFWEVPVQPVPGHLGVGHKGHVSAVACSPDGLYLATAGTDGTVKLWDAISGSELRFWDATTHQVVSLAFSPDGRFLATGSGPGVDPSFRQPELRGEAKVWDVQTGQLRFTLVGQSYLVRASFSPDGKRLVVASGGEEVQVCDAATGQLLDKLPLDRHTPATPAEVWSAAFSPDGRLLAAAEYWGGRVTVWDAHTGAVQRQLGGDKNAWQSVSRVAFSPDGRYLAAQASDVIVWDVRSGAQVSRLPRPESLFDIAFSPDGKRLVTAGKRLQVWDTATGAELLRLPPEVAYAVTFSPDGERLLSGNGSVILIRDGAPRLKSFP